jgi:alpha,alpha-trehalase
VILSARKVVAAVFDMDGVITDSAVAHRQAWKATFDSYLADVAARTGHPQAPFSDEDYLRYVDGKPRGRTLARSARSAVARGRARRR